MLRSLALPLIFICIPLLMLLSSPHNMSNFHPHEGILYVRTREGTGQPRGPPKRFPRGKPETGQHITKQHEATGGAVHLLACTAASVGDVRVDDFLFAMCVTLWGWDA